MREVVFRDDEFSFLELKRFLIKEVYRVLNRKIYINLYLEIL